MIGDSILSTNMGGEIECMFVYQIQWYFVSNPVFLHTGSITSFVLRGLGRQKLVFWLALLGFWVVGVPLGAILTFVVGLGVFGIWWGFAIGVYFASIIGIWRLRRVEWDHEAKRTQTRLSSIDPKSALTETEANR